MAPTTLRAWAGIGPIDTLDPHHTALVLIDIQEEYFAEGRLTLPDGPAALDRAVTLLAWARAEGVAIIHVQHVALTDQSPLFTPGTPAVRLRAEVAPLPDEPVIVKPMPSGFVGTSLHDELQRRDIDTLVIAGLMTHVCVSSTTRDALSLGYRAVVAADACATRDLPDATGTGTIPHQRIHEAVLASLADRFADVTTTATVVALPLRPCVY